MIVLYCPSCHKVNHPVTIQFFQEHQEIELRCAYCSSVLYWKYKVLAKDCVKISTLVDKCQPFDTEEDGK